MTTLSEQLHDLRQQNSVLGSESATIDIRMASGTISDEDFVISKTRLVEIRNEQQVISQKIYDLTA